MSKNIMDEKLMTDIANDRILSDLCIKWVVLNKKKNLTDEEQAEKLMIHQEIRQFHKDNYEDTDYD